MRQPAGPTVVKKYANRRLYNTGTSSYVTLEGVADLLRRGEELVVTDARTGRDLTRPVLAQIILEEEGRGEALLPLAVLRQLIRLYGSDRRAQVPGHIARSIEAFLGEDRTPDTPARRFSLVEDRIPA